MIAGFEIAALITSLIWLVAGIGLGTFIGFFIGRMFTIKNESRKLFEERKLIHEALNNLIDSSDQMTVDVDENNRSLAQVEKDVRTIESNSGVGNLRDRLLNSLNKVVETNQKMENDLAITKYQLESQAQELDRSRKEARTDGLCQVGNRKAFEEAIRFMLSRYRVNQTSFALLLVDLDHFKRINDTYGHQAGDEVLISVGSALKECVRPEDIVTRIGGDEFAILLKSVDLNNVDAVGKRVRDTIEHYNFSIGIADASTVVTTSMGIAIISPGESPESLYKRADDALYKSKEMGRNRLAISRDKPQKKEDVCLDKPVDISAILPTDTLPGFEDAQTTQ